MLAENWLLAQLTDSPEIFFNPFALVCVVGVFLACCLVELLRQKLFQLLGISRLCDRFADKLQNKWK